MQARDEVEAERLATQDAQGGLDALRARTAKDRA
jgi:hypothetical protein